MIVLAGSFVSKLHDGQIDIDLRFDGRLAKTGKVKND